jgi:hypothetical protein
MGSSWSRLEHGYSPVEHTSTDLMLAMSLGEATLAFFATEMSKRALGWDDKSARYFPRDVVKELDFEASKRGCILLTEMLETHVVVLCVTE